MYERKDAPVRVGLEMRLTGGSDVLLAPQRGNTNGTVSIEVLTTLTTPKDDWASFLQLIADKWTSYKDENGSLLKAPPHWAKQWSGLKVNKKPVEQFFEEDAYKDAFVVDARGSTVKETRARFGNSTLERLIFE